MRPDFAHKSVAYFIDKLFFENQNDHKLSTKE